MRILLHHRAVAAKISERILTEDGVEARSRSFQIASRVIQVSGDVNAKSAPKLRDRLRKVFNSKPQAIIVKLAQVESMDSAGIAVLVEACQWAKKERILFILADPSKPAKAMIEMARLDRFFPVSEGIDRSLKK